MPAAAEYPSEVKANIALLESLGIWHLVSRNQPAKSCADAASKRYRLGSRGIPLYDELKSHLGVFGKPGKPEFVVAHSRGHLERSDELINEAVGEQVGRAEPEDLALLNLEYGLINPFSLARVGVLQLFDPSVLVNYGPPRTMMTNLGDFEFGVEFIPSEVVELLPHVRVLDVADHDPRLASPEPHHVGILTGNGPESGIALWEHINQRIRTDTVVPFYGDTSFPRFTMVSVPEMGLSMDLPVRLADVRSTVLESIRGLCLAGADIIGIACNTTQFFSSEASTICNEHGATFVSLVDATERKLRELGISEFDLLGIGAVSDFSQWSDFRRLVDHFEVRIPDAPDVERITELAFEVKQRRTTGRAISELGRLIRSSTSTDTVVLALTELSILAQHEPKLEKRSGKTFLDTLSILGDAIADAVQDSRRQLFKAIRESRIATALSLGIAE